MDITGKHSKAIVIIVLGQKTAFSYTRIHLDYQLFTFRTNTINT